MNFAILALVGVAVAGALWALGLAPRLWTIAGAALMLGGAGFAFQGGGHLRGRPAAANAASFAIDPGMVAFRGTVFAVSRADSFALAGADTRLEAGDAHAAVEGLRREIAVRPDSAALWTALGYVLALHDHTLSPAASFAFRHAIALAPDAPGPAFFLGMAEIDAGDVPAARRSWAAALARTPVDAAYRAVIADRIVAIDRFERLTGARRGSAVSP